MQIKNKKNNPKWVGSFENLLSLVVQFYYKKDLGLNELVKEKSDDTRKEVKVSIINIFIKG